MLGHLYYLFGLIIFLLNIILTSNTFKLLKTKEWILKFEKVSGRYPLKSDFKNNDYEKLILANSIWAMTFFWLFFGLVTNSVWVFAFVILYNFLVTIVSKQIGQFNIFSKFLEILRISSNTIIIGFLVMNHFHLHMDIIQFLQK
jgi:hypothetical protein